MSIVLPVTFSGSKCTSSYIYLDRSPRTVLFHYGAGSRAINYNIFQQVPEISVLIIERWPLRHDGKLGPDILADLTEYTKELLDHLGIVDVVQVCHSAGIYPLLSFAASHGEMIKHNVLLSPHIPPPASKSRVLSLLNRVPLPLFKFVTKFDARAGDWLSNFGFAARNRDDFWTHHLGSAVLDEQISREREVDDNAMNVDYALSYGKLQGYHDARLLEMYQHCEKVIWYTCPADLFFGPDTVNRCLELTGLEADVRIIESSHENLFQRRDVWREIVSLMG